MSTGISSQIRKPYKHCDKSWDGSMDFRKWSGFVETDINDNTLLLPWINYCKFTVFDVVPGSTIKCRPYALCMNSTRVQYAPEVRQHNLCKIIGDLNNSFKISLLFSLVYFFF